MPRGKRNDRSSSSHIDAGTDTGADAGAVADGRSAGDIDADADGFVGVGGSSTTDFDAPIGAESYSELPIGGGSATEHARKRATTRRRNAGGGRSTRTDTGTETAEAREVGDSETVPREISFSSLGTPKGGKQSAASARQKELTRTFISEGFAFAFVGAAKLFNDDDWKLPQDDADELAERFQHWMQSGGSKRVAAFEKFVAKHQPLASLLIALATVVGPRFANTRRKRRNALATKTTKAGTGADAGATAANVPPVSGGGNAMASETHGPDASNDAASGNGRGNASHRSIRREDLREIFGNDDAGAM